MGFIIAYLSNCFQCFLWCFIKSVECINFTSFLYPVMYIWYFYMYICHTLHIVTIYIYVNKIINQELRWPDSIWVVVNSRHVISTNSNFLTICWASYSFHCVKLRYCNLWPAAAQCRRLNSADEREIRRRLFVLKSRVSTRYLYMLSSETSEGQLDMGFIGGGAWVKNCFIWGEL
jgi:hypothetical protein